MSVVKACQKKELGLLKSAQWFLSGALCYIGGGGCPRNFTPGIF